MTAETGSGGGIAIIGIACRFPGADDWRTFWRNLTNGVESIATFSEQELLKAGVDPALLQDPEYVKASPVISDPDRFDAGFFEYSPREARLIDPQHRVFLEVAWQAFEDAGYWPEKHDGVVGVFAGAGGLVSSYFAANPNLQGSTGGVEHIGNDKDFIATRVSYKLNLTGPSLTVQTACSTSMVAINLACSSILNGECDMAVVGAATVRVPHTAGYLARKGDILSPDGHCRAFDAAAEGTVFGSGAGAVLLKHVDDAIADGDHIYAVIRGTAVNNDGANKVSYTASSVGGQAKAMLEAFSRAGVKPRSIDYVEAHGTGTIVGDPLEVDALTRVFRTDTRETGFCGIGSVKTNIGHLEQTAGIASLIKVALALHHGQIPPSLNFNTPNPKIRFAESPFYVNTTLRDWPRQSRVRRAAINSLGLGGTNAFAILEEAPAAAAEPATAVERPLHVLPLSGRTEPALRAQIERWRGHLATTGDPLPDVCHTAATGRAEFDHRFAAIGATAQEIAEQLAAAPAALPRRSGRRPLAFLFTGQGAQYPGMAEELFNTQPVFRAALERCDALLQPHLKKSLRTVVFSGGKTKPLIDQTAYTQPALFALEWSLAELWRSWGIVPDAVIGHSVGEYVAACVAGVYTLEEALALIAARGRLMQSLPKGGAMAAVFADGPTVQALVAGQPGVIAIAAYNAPENTVVSGSAEAVAAVIEAAKTAGLDARPLTVSHAFHSPLMQPIAAELEALAATFTARPPKLPVIGNLAGTAWDGPPSPSYWSEHALKAVRFVDGLQALAGRGIVDFLEVGPGATLASLARQTLAADGSRRFLTSLGKGREWRQLAETAASLWRSGAPFDWRGFDAPYRRRRLPAPTYCFQRERYWLDALPSRATATAPGHEDLLGRRLKSPLPAWQFEAVYDLDALTWLTDHRIFGPAVLPATAGLVALAKAGQERLGRNAAVVALTYREAMVVPDEGSLIVQAVVADDRDGLAVELDSHDGKPDAEWRQHMIGRLEPVADPAIMSLDGRLPGWADTATMTAVPPERYYAAILPLGFGYGPGFRGIVELWQGDGTAISRVRLPQHLSATAHALHPALLDACLHIYPALVPDYRDLAELTEDAAGTYLPISFERFEIYRPGTSEVRVAARLRTAEDDGSGLTVDIGVFAEDGAPVALIGGLLVKRLRREAIVPATERSIDDALHRIDWIERPALPEPAAPAAGGGWLVLAADGGHGAALAERLARLGLTVATADPQAWFDQATAETAVRDLAAGLNGVAGIALMPGFDQPSEETMTGETVVAAERAVSGSTLAVIKAVAALADAGEIRPRIWLVTRAGQSPLDGTLDGDPLQAMLWGIGRVAALEHAELWGGMVDVGVAPDPDALVREILGGDGEDQVALRGGSRFAPRLRREDKEPVGQAIVPAVDPAAAYLITGGLGALGLKVADWLVDEQGARCLVLTARRPPSGEAAAAIAALEAKGARVVFKAADVARPADVERLFAEIAAELPPLKGILHCAGVLDDGVIAQMDWDKYVRATGPKVVGGWLLHRMSRDLPLDHFMLFSSVLGVTGSMGQVNYAAGNCFLDGLAAWRRNRGLPAQVVNWGPWADTGLATESGKRGEAIWQARGTEYIPADEGIRLLQTIMTRQLRQSVVSISDWTRWASQYPKPPPLMADLVLNAPTAAAAPGLSREEVMAELAAVPEEARRDVLMRVAGTLVRSVLEIAGEIPLDQPLRELGLDSLMAITVINQLDAAVGVRLPAATMLKGPSLAQLVDEVLPKVTVVAPNPAISASQPTAAAAPATVARWAEPLAEAGNWLVPIRANPNARYRLVCFPFAGGGSAVFRDWSKDAAADAEILAVEPPGRLSRVSERPLDRIEDFVSALLPELDSLLDRPLAFFGHCIGGVTMYEVARALVERRSFLPMHLFASGSRPPHRLITDGAFEQQLVNDLLQLPDFDPTLPTHRQSDGVLAEVLRHFRIDATEQMLSIPELREIVLPVVRAEFEMASRYSFRPVEPWQVPITSFRGRDDLYVSHEDAMAWGDFTTARFDLLTSDGAHFGVVEDRPYIQAVIARTLAG